MTQNWAFAGEPPVVGGPEGVSTLVRGSTFCIGERSGDIRPDGAQGLFFRDLRSISRWELRVDGYSTQALACYHPEPSEATYVARVPPTAGRADSHLLVTRHRVIADGMREEVTVRNLGQEAAGCTLTLLVDADFADLFEVKENRVVAHPDRVARLAGEAGEVLFTHRWLGRGRDVRVRSSPVGRTSPGLLTVAAAIEPRSSWTLRLEVDFAVDGLPVEPGTSGEEAPKRWGRRLREDTRISTPYPALETTLRTARADLAALLIKDPDHPDREVVAAGAPWFMTVFGRDSLLTAWMALPLDPGLAVGTLHTLAARQGSRVDPLTEEQPGRILHEMRFGSETGLALGGGTAYYGTVDATALFVMLVGEAAAWGVDGAEISALLPHVDRALDWIREHGDRDGDGFVEYQRATDRGLLNQGWKDSGDGVTGSSGVQAVPPIALCEVQGYVYGAYRARARLARLLGDEDGARSWDQRAGDLKAVFNERFWLPDRGYFALALDRDKRPVDALTSNVGHCLWTGVVEADKAAALAGHLGSEALFSGWGVRTLADTMAAYNPLSYHNGSVWPHDTAIVVAGLARYGFDELARRIATAVVDAAVAFGSRLPELWCGFARAEYEPPLPYPTSCSPQAWAAGAPLLLVRSLLGLHPDLPAGRLYVAPSLPASWLPLTLEGVRMGDARVRVHVDADGVSVDGLGEGVELVLGRPD